PNNNFVSPFGTPETSDKSDQTQRCMRLPAAPLPDRRPRPRLSAIPRLTADYLAPQRHVSPATCVPAPPVAYFKFLSMRSLVRRGARTAHADLACHRSSRRQMRPPPAG